MHQNLTGGTLDLYTHRARLWWRLNGRPCVAEVDLDADRIFDLGQTGWVVFEQTYNRDNPDRMHHRFTVTEPEQLAGYLGIDLFDLTHLS